MSPARTGLVYGVGGMRAAARGDRMVWALHKASLANGIVPVVPAGVVAEAFRTEARSERIASFLAGSDVEDLTAGMARRIGDLAVRAQTPDLIVVSTAEVASRRNCAVVASRQASMRAAADLLTHDLVLYGV